METQDVELLCGICGEPHACNECDFLTLADHVEDSPVVSKARQSLPTGLRIVTMSDLTHSVIAERPYESGTRFGPVDAKKSFTVEVTTNLPLKLFCGEENSDEYFSEFFLNNSDEFNCNWLFFVQAATHVDEQNLICYPDGQLIYFAACKQIEIGDHLKVWYAPYYGNLMEKPMLGQVEIEIEDNIEEDLNVGELVKQQKGIRDRKEWLCKFCGKNEDEIKSFAEHILHHYCLQKRKVCEFCNGAFKTRKNLKKHVSIVHSNDRYASNILIENTHPNVEDKAPLMEQPIDDIFDLELENHLNLESWNTNHFNFDDRNFENETFVCDICLKNFTRLKFLIIHLYSHTGRYNCNTCSRVFTRNENLQSHSCNERAFACTHCSQKFSLRKYLNRHVAVKHTGRFVCKIRCGKTFDSFKSLKEHDCDENVLRLCNLCGKEFRNKKNLKRHMQIHESHKEKRNETEFRATHLCEICSNVYNTKKLLRQHMYTHKERDFCCLVCDKTFVRKTTFLEHMEIHKENSPHTCEICKQKFTLKKYLSKHLLTHDEECKYPCKACPSKFKQRANMLTHYNRMHSTTCPHCAKKFETSDELKRHVLIHTETCFECPLCNTSVKLRSSLMRHLKRKHPDEKVDTKNIKSVQKKIGEVEEDIYKLLNIDDFDEDFIIDANTDKLENVLDFNSLEIEFEKNYNGEDLSNREMLSMPNLTQDQNPTYAESTFVLDNGAIVEPLEPGKVFLVYN